MSRSTLPPTEKKIHVMLQCLPRTNLKEWCSYMELLTRETLGDISEALKSGVHKAYTAPAVPARPIRVGVVEQDPLADALLPEAIAYMAGLDAYEMTLKPTYKAALNRYLKQVADYEEANKKLYAIVLMHMSSDSRSRVELKAAEYAAAEAASDGLALYLLVKASHIYDGGDKWTQVQNQLAVISRMEQKSLPFEKYLSQFNTELKYLHELDHVLNDADKISRFLPTVNRLYFQRWVTDQSIAGTLPDTFAALTDAMMKYDATTKSMTTLFGTQKRDHPASELSNLTEALVIEDDDADEALLADGKQAPPKEDKKPDKKKEKKRSATPPRGGAAGRGGATGTSNKLKMCSYCVLIGLAGVGHTIAICNKLKKTIADEANVVELGVESIVLTTDVHSPYRDRLPIPDRALVLDCGATTSIVKNKNLLINLRKLQVPIAVRGVSSTQLLADSIGDIPHFGSALYVPQASRNLLSWSAVKDRVVWNEERDLFHVTHRDSKGHADFVLAPSGLYSYVVPTASTLDALVTTEEPLFKAHFPERQRKRMLDAIKLHEALDHPGDPALTIALNNGCYSECQITAKDLRDARKHYGPCLRCLAGKMTCAPSPASTSVPPPHIGYRIHSDIIFVRGADGAKTPYVLTVEDLTGYIIIAKIRNKTKGQLEEAQSKVFARYKSYGHFIKQWRSDHETAFKSTETHVNDKGAQLQVTAPDRHEKVSERNTRTLRERMRATLGALTYRLPGKLYGHLLMHVVSSMNVIPNTSTGKRTPRELVTGEKVNAAVSFGHPFGTLGLFKTPKDSKPDHMDRAELGIIIGRDYNSKGTVTVFLLNSRTVVSRHKYTAIPLTEAAKNILNDIADMEELPPFEFLISDRDECDQGNDINVDSIPPTDSRGDSGENLNFYGDLGTPLETPPVMDYETTSTIPQERRVHFEQPMEHEVPEHAPITDPPLQATQTAPTPFEQGSMDIDPRNIIGGEGRPHRNVKRVNYKDAFHCDGCNIFNLTFKAAKTEFGDEAAKASVTKELRNMMDMGALEPVHSSTLSKDEYKRILPSHLFLKDKYNAAGKFESLKSRLVGGGHMQDHSEYGSITSPTVRTQSVFLALNEAAFEHRTVSTIDIKGAYLNATLKSVIVYIRLAKDLSAIYATLRPQYKKFLRPDGTMILRVRKALYGLIESAMLWYEHLCASLISLGYKCLASDKGMFTREDAKGKSTLCVHVDDILHTCTHPSHEEHLRAGLRSLYKDITLHEGNEVSYLGMLINCNREKGEIKVSQPAYIDNLIKKHNVTKEYNTPCTGTLMTISPNAKPIDAGPHRSAVMAAFYLSGRSRTDLSFVLSYLVTRLNAPTTDDASNLERLLGYIKRTKDHALTFRPDSMTLKCYADASYAIHDDARSHYGNTMQVGSTNAPFHNKSGVIKSTCRSSTEAEIASLNELVSDLLHSRDLLAELGHKQPITKVLEDNTATIHLLDGPQANYQTRSKHIKVRYAFFREQIRLQLITLQHCSTDKMLADIHTKPITGAKYTDLSRSLLGLPGRHSSGVC